MDCSYETEEMFCGVEPQEDACAYPSLAMLYSPWQEWETVYDLQTALCHGTIFPGLDKPFLKGACPNV